MNLSVIIAQRGHPEKFDAFMQELRAITSDPATVEVLVVIDDNDNDFLPVHNDIESRHQDFSLKFHVVKQSEHQSKDYWNYLARQAQGRWIIPICCDNKIHTYKWDKMIHEKMAAAAQRLGDDFLLGLTKDNIKRRGEDPEYPNFSCHPVLSREFVNKMGYFWEERYWTWGCDHAAAMLFRKLEKMTRQRRIVSLTDVLIYDYNTVHTTDETDPKKLHKMRLEDKSYQKNLRITSEHPFNMTDRDCEIEAKKIMGFIKL